MVTSGETLPQGRLQKRSDLISGARGRRCLRRGIVPGSIRSELEVLGRELDDLERAIATANDQARRGALASRAAALRQRRLDLEREAARRREGFRARCPVDQPFC
ncbi:MAG: hypothetical protein KBG48_15975 [Kofleriaceae bacterium]|nr:hypothetical protein [Kofleriaceae bacterium]MBP9168897.1 hypothetical protein [Kofleriaceae bacterium]